MDCVHQTDGDGARNDVVGIAGGRASVVTRQVAGSIGMNLGVGRTPKHALRHACGPHETSESAEGRNEYRGA